MDIKYTLMNDVITSCENEYNDKIGLFNQLDNKAQQIVGFSGIFLGFLITIIDNEKFIILIQTYKWNIYLFSLLIILLLTAIIICLHTMKITDTDERPTIDKLKREYLNLIKMKSDELTIDNISNILNRKLDYWRITLASIDKVNKNKAKLILYAQLLFGVSIFILGIFILLLIYYFI